MSYIDTFDHQYVGAFAGLPIYYPRETVEGDGAHDFSCGPENLVLGGGGGEHPGLVFRRLDCLAMRFVYDAVDWGEDKNRSEKELFGDFPIWDFLGVAYEEQFDYAGWSVQNHHEFFERCSSVALGLPFGSDEGLSFEEWLAVSIGELVWFSFPQLIESLEPIRKLHPKLQPIAGNVTVAPPGYPVKYGRKLVGGKVVWGDDYFKGTGDDAK